jgi:hypothetical protein
MRHFLSPSVAHLAQGVRATSPSAALVSAAGIALPRATSALGALPPAVARSLDIAQRAQDNRSSAIRPQADHDVQCDHGPPPAPKGSTSRGTCATKSASSRVSHTVPRNDRGLGVAISGPSLFGVGHAGVPHQRHHRAFPGSCSEGGQARSLKA